MSTARPILIVEGDDALRHVLVDHLAEGGEFQPVQAATLGEATKHLGAVGARFDLIILEVDLPDGDGRDFCAYVRQQGHKMPVIMLAGACEDADVVRGLDAGASDYVRKPLRPGELLARLRAQLRFFDNSEDAVFTIGSYTFRPSAKLLVEPGGDRCIRLTGKEVAVLKLLYRTGNRTVPRKVLLNEVWGYGDGVATNTLASHIYQLRQKMEADPANCRLLISMPGGYRLDAAAG